MSDETHYGVIEIDYDAFHDFLKRALLLPDRYMVWGCIEEEKHISILVEHDDIPCVEDGKPRPQVVPRYVREKEKLRLTGITIDGVEQPIQQVEDLVEQKMVTVDLGHIRKMIRGEVGKQLDYLLKIGRITGGVR